ncbi:hypothetical protein ACFVUN_02870 [Kitasatospora griseola]
MNDAADHLGNDFVPAFSWLTADVVATAGAGDVGWLRRFDVALGT